MFAKWGKSSEHKLHNSITHPLIVVYNIFASIHTTGAAGVEQLENL